MTAPKVNVSQREPAVDALIDGLRERIEGVREFNGCGFWTTCTGCYESEDGYPNGAYPFSDVLQCTLGAGCSECGGIGAVFDATDYDELVSDMLAEDAADPELDQLTSSQARIVELERALEGFALAAECAAGVDEGAPHEEAYSEILKSHGSAMASAYDAARQALGDNS